MDTYRATNLCTDCYPEWERHEVLTIFAMSLCAACGRLHDRHGEPRVEIHVFPRDPRLPPQSERP